MNAYSFSQWRHCHCESKDLHFLCNISQWYHKEND